MRLATACLLAASIVNAASLATGQEKQPAPPRPPKAGPLIAYQLTIVNVTVAPDEEVDQATHVELAKVLAKWEEQGRIQWQKTMRLTATEQQAAFVQLSERKPVVTGAQEQGGERRRVRSLAMEDTGLILGVTGLVEEEGTVLFEVDAQHSYFTPNKDASLESEDSFPDKLKEQNQVQTTVRCKSGLACLIGSTEIKAAEEKSKTLVFVSAEVVK
jgi:hypothetical protein